MRCHFQWAQKNGRSLNLTPFLHGKLSLVSAMITVLFSLPMQSTGRAVCLDIDGKPMDWLRTGYKHK